MTVQQLIDALKQENPDSEAMVSVIMERAGADLGGDFPIDGIYSQHPSQVLIEINTE